MIFHDKGLVLSRQGICTPRKRLVLETCLDKICVCVYALSHTSHPRTPFLRHRVRHSGTRISSRTMNVAVSLLTTFFCLLACGSASRIRGAASPGAAILKTIRTLETAEALMKKTQAAMQAKIDKLNANMAVGLDKHIDGTVNKIVNAYHLKEKEAIANAATNRLNQWATGGKNKTAKENVTMPSVDPAKIVAEEQAEEDKKPKESTEST